MTVIRYGNRKLYSKDLSRYVTLTEVRDFVSQGIPVTVTKYGTNEDITEYTLAAAKFYGNFRAE